jgi:hypothetical protein
VRGPAAAPPGAGLAARRRRPRTRLEPAPAVSSFLGQEETKRQNKIPHNSKPRSMLSPPHEPGQLTPPPPPRRGFASRPRVTRVPRRDVRTTAATSCDGAESTHEEMSISIYRSIDLSISIDVGNTFTSCVINGESATALLEMRRAQAPSSAGNLSPPSSSACIQGRYLACLCS